MPIPQASVFISYSRQDQTFVRQLLSSLSNKGQNVWVDWESIEKGEAWLERIRAGIEKQDTFVFVVSPDSLTSEICNIELAYAIEQGKRIIPLVRREVIRDRKPLPDIVTAWFGTTWQETAEANWEKLHSINFLFCRESDNFSAAITELHKTINRDLEHLTLHTHLGVRALEWQRHALAAGFLIREDELVEAETWLDKADAGSKEPHPTPLHREFIRTARVYEDRVNRRIRLLRSATAGLLVAGGVFLVVAIGAALLATSARNEADEAGQDRNQAHTQVANAQNTLTPIPQTLQALTTDILEAQATGTAIAAAVDEQSSLAKSREWANMARSISQILDGDNRVAGLLAIRALNLHYTQEADSALVAALTNLFPDRVLINENDVTTVAFSPDGKYLVTGDLNGKVHVWDYQASTEKLTFDVPEGSITSAIYNPDGSIIVTGSTDAVVRFWDANTGELVKELTGNDSLSLWDLCFSPDGRYLAAAGGDVWLWDAKTGEFIRDAIIDSVYAETVTFSPDGKYLLTTGTGVLVELWDLETGVYLRRFDGHTDSAATAAFSPDGKYLLTGAWDNTARLWDVETGEQLQVYEHHQDLVSSVAFSPNGQYILTGSFDSTAYLLDFKTGEVIRYIDAHLTGWGNRIAQVAFSPDSAYFATASEDDTARLWDTSITTFTEYACGAIYSDFSPEQRIEYGIPNDPTCPMMAGLE